MYNLIEKKYEGKLIQVKESNNSHLLLYVNGDLVADLDGETVINGGISELLPSSFKESLSEDTVDSFCSDVNEFIKQWHC